MAPFLLVVVLACSGAVSNPDDSDSGPTGDTTSDSGSTTNATDTGIPCPPDDTSGEGTIASECCAVSPWLQLLGGESEPEDLVEGGFLPLSYSPQYGWELQIFPKVCQTRDLVSLLVGLMDVETGSMLQWDTLTERLYPDAEGSCCGDAYLRYERLDVQEIPGHEGQNIAETLCNRTVSLTIEATDFDGRVAAETLNLVITADEEALGHACGE